MPKSPDFLREEYTIDTPENVTFGYEVTGIGSRFIGALIDTTILAVALLFLNLAIFVAIAVAQETDSVLALTLEGETGWIAGLLLALYALVNFALIWGYYIVFELMWMGQTPGKRVAKTRVVAMDGSAAGLLAVVIRNLVRFIDFLPFGYGVGLVTMFFNRQARRLGDFAGSTLVVNTRSETVLESLGRSEDRSVLSPAQSKEQAQTAAHARLPHLARLTPDDYELVIEILDRHNRGAVSVDMLQRAARAIAKKLEVEAPPADWSQSRRFLAEVVNAYRTVKP